MLRPRVALLNIPPMERPTIPPVSAKGVGFGARWDFFFCFVLFGMVWDTLCDGDCTSVENHSGDSVQSLGILVSTKVIVLGH